MSDRPKSSPRAEPHAGVERSVPGGLDADTLVALVAEIAHELRTGGEEPPAVHLDTDLGRDLALDSLTRMELLARLERAAGASLADRVLAEAETPRELLRAFESARPAGLDSGSTPESTPTPGLGSEPGSGAARGASGEGSSAIRGGGAPRPARDRLGASGRRTASAGGLDSAPEPEEVPTDAATLVDALAWHASVHPDRVHVRLLDENGAETVLTYGGLLAGASRFADGLVRAGLTPGRAVAIMLPTGVEYLECFIGVQLAGGTPLPIYPPARLAQVEDHLRRHERILANADAEWLITFDEVRRLSRLLAARSGVRCRLATVRDLAAGRSSPDDSGFAPLAPGRDDTAFLQYTSGSTGQPKGVVLTHRNVIASLRAMGQALAATPRDVFVSWLPLYHDMGLIGGWLGSLVYGFPLVLMSPLTFLARPARWLWAIHRYGGTLSGGPNFAFDLCTRRLADEEIDGLDLSSWRLAFNGAEPVHAETLRAFGARFAPFGIDTRAFAPVYGLAEATLGVAFTPIGRGPRVERVMRTTLERQRRAVPIGPAAGSASRSAPGGERGRERSPARGQAEEPAQERIAGQGRTPASGQRPANGRAPLYGEAPDGEAPGRGQGRMPGQGRTPEEASVAFVSSGIPIPGFEVRTVDEGGRETPERVEGRLQLRGPSTTSGYFRDPAATRALFDGDWLESGDLAYIAGGEVFVTGRVKDVIIRAGRNLHPYDFEQAAGDLPGVRRGCVALFAARARGGAEAGAGTERLVAAVETRETEPARRAEIRTALERLAEERLGQPADEVVLVPPHSVLKTSSGKIRRRAMAERYESGRLTSPDTVRPSWVRFLGLAAGGIAPGARRAAARFGELVFAARVWTAVGLAGAVVWPVVAAVGRPRFGRACLRAAAWTVFRLSGLRVTVDEGGAEAGAVHRCRGAPCVVTSNHASYFDGLVLTAALRGSVRFVAKAELREKPLARWFLDGIGTLYVDRFDAARSVAHAGGLAEALHAGESIAIFPEGTLHRMPGLMPFQMGAFAAAVEAGAPVVPVVLRGTRSLMRSETWFPRRAAVRVRIGTPIHPPALEPASAPDGAEGAASRTSFADGPASADSAPSAGGGSEGGPSGGGPSEAARSPWSRAVRLRNEVRAWMLAHCGEPDLADRNPLRALAERRAAQKTDGAAS